MKTHIKHRISFNRTGVSLQNLYVKRVLSFQKHKSETMIKTIQTKKNIYIYTKHNRKEEAAILHGSIRRTVPVLNPILVKNSSALSYNISRENIHFTKYVIETP